MNIELDLGWTQAYMGLKYHMEDALEEKQLDKNMAISAPPIALFSKRYYSEINELKHNKIYDFCFIGSINSSYEKRKWVIEFAKNYFTKNSIFVNTDNDPNWQLLGEFDYSKLLLGYCPKAQMNNQSRDVQYRTISENTYYFETMCQSKYVLCPAGDTSWSFRFYEVLLCKSIPIVESWHHTYRTREESLIPYKYVLANNIANEQEIPYNDYVNENTKILEKYHFIS